MIYRLLQIMNSLELVKIFEYAFYSLELYLFSKPALRE
jgi:hypothetical protein